MARIPDETVNRIKQDISLLRLVESQGHEVTRQGKDSVVRCPFHEDKTPSCIISPKTNLFNCFGCGAGGSVIDWVMKTQGVSFRFACEILQKDLGLVADTGGGAAPKARNTTTKLAPPLAADADHQTALRQVIDYYHETLKQSPEAQDYLRSRGLDHPELIERFRLGYANRTLGYRLPEKNRKAGAELRGKLQAIGILRDSGHEHFNGSLVMPVMDENGTITEVYGRKLLGQRLRKGTPQHLYLPGPHEGVWNIEALKASKEIILCEALIDAMTFWVHGFRHVTASYGTGGFTASHLAAFKQYGTERVLIAYDRDAAGNKAAEALAKQLQAEGIECFRVLLPKGMDVNEYAQQVTPAPKSLGLVLRKAEWMGEGKALERQLDIASEVPDFHRESASALAADLAVDVEDENEIGPETEAPKPTPQASFEETALDRQATPVPALPTAEVTVQAGDHELFITLGSRVYRVRGLDKNSDCDQLKIQLLARSEDQFHMDKLDLYSSKQRQVFINQASLELGVKDEVIKKDLGKVLLTLEEQQAKQQENSIEKKPAELEAGDRQAALDLLRDPDLLNRILADFSRCGVVGEETNKLVGYLAAGSRKLDRPLAVILQSTSAAGKSSLMDAVLNLMPEDERVQYSAMTGQSLFYMGETNLKHKILAIAEEEGASNASYALKLLQSEGEITIASTGKDDTTGNLVTKEYRVEGPVMLFLTTTAIDIDEELLNRCLVLTVNESREQTRAIHEAQRTRRTLKGLEGKLEKEQLVKLHRNAQKLLKPLAVINPYADQLTFLDDKTRTRRDHEKYLTLIDSIALLHQYQREIKTVEHAGKTLEYIEVELSDIDTANRLAHEILGRTLDELPPQTRKLLRLIQQMVQAECQKKGIEQSDFRFSRRDVREYTGWSDGQLKIHCTRLTDLEYLLVHRGGRGQHLVYELLFDGSDNEQPQLMGLIDPEKLGYDAQKSGAKAQKSAPSQGQVSPKLAPSQTGQKRDRPRPLWSTAKAVRLAPKTLIRWCKKWPSNVNAPWPTSAMPWPSSTPAFTPMCSVTWRPCGCAITPKAPCNGEKTASAASWAGVMSEAWTGLRTSLNRSWSGYQKYLYYYRQESGQPLSPTSRCRYLTNIRQFFKWLTQENYLLYNPASELVLPKTTASLPVVLTEEEVEALMEQPDTETPYGLRDRAILEVFYSTGIRRTELCRLELSDLSLSRLTLFIREGKGGRDRLLPVGARAARWLTRYVNEVRPQLLLDINEPALFLNDYGEPFRDSKLGDRVKRYLKKAGIEAPGSCHLLRHAMATHMLENGAELRFIQAMLGHADFRATQVYTHVSIRKLQEIHAATHPAKLEDKAVFLASLAAENPETQE